MATERLSMRQIRQILRQKWSLGRTHPQSQGISCGAVGTTVLRARAPGLDWAQVDTLSDDALQARVYGPPTPPTRSHPSCWVAVLRKRGLGAVENSEETTRGLAGGGF